MNDKATGINDLKGHQIKYALNRDADQLKYSNPSMTKSPRDFQSLSSLDKIILDIPLSTPNDY